MSVNKVLLWIFVGMFGLLAAGCGGETSSSSPSSSGDTAQCSEVYAFAPAGYVINIVSGDAVILDPLANDFQVFCDVSSARKGLETALDAKRIPQGDWKIFRVYGPWGELATEVSAGVFILKRPAPLVDWVD